MPNSYSYADIRKLEREIAEVNNYWERKNRRLLKKFERFKRKSIILKKYAGTLTVHLYESYNNQDKHNITSVYRMEISILPDYSSFNDGLINCLVSDRRSLLYTAHVSNPLFLYMYAYIMANKLGLRLVEGSYVRHELKNDHIVDFCKLKEKQ